MLKIFERCIFFFFGFHNWRLDLEVYLALCIFLVYASFPITGFCILVNATVVDYCHYRLLIFLVDRDLSIEE